MTTAGSFKSRAHTSASLGASISPLGATRGIPDAPRAGVELFKLLETALLSPLDNPKAGTTLLFTKLAKPENLPITLAGSSPAACRCLTPLCTGLTHGAQNAAYGLSGCSNSGWSSRKLIAYTVPNECAARLTCWMPRCANNFGSIARYAGMRSSIRTGVEAPMPGRSAWMIRMLCRLARVSRGV